MSITQIKPKYQIGDVVTIKGYNEEDKPYNDSVSGFDPQYVADMRGLAGREFEIKSWTGTAYRLKGQMYSWSDAMFEDSSLTPELKAERDFWKEANKHA